MEAKLKENASKNINVRYRFEHKLHSGFMVLDDEFNKVADVKFYIPGQVVYCCAWFNINGKRYSGSAKDNGYGDQIERCIKKSFGQVFDFDYYSFRSGYNCGYNDCIMSAFEILESVTGKKLHLFTYYG